MACPCEHKTAGFPRKRFRGFGALGQSSSQPEVGRDIVSGAVAFGAPLIYHYAAPKKWPRLSTWGNVGAVVGIYLLTSFVYTRATATAP